MDRNTKRLHYQKAGKITTKNRPPLATEGSNGDIAICDKRGEILLFYKFKNKWHQTSKDWLLSSGGTISGNLTVDGVFDAEYPGKILGYSKYSNTTDAVGYETITVGASWTQLQTANGNNVRTTFNIPTSDKVEITFNAYVRSTNDALYLGLSESSATYVPVGDEYEYDVTSYGVYYADESDKNYITVKWVVDGFTTMSETYYIWAKGQGTIYINHGLSYRTTDYYPPILVKTIELPDTMISET